MGKVQQQVIKTVPFGEVIASSISCDYLITCGVSNWGGFAIASGLHVLSRCAVFQRFKYHGISGSDDVTIDDLLLSEKQVYKITFQGYDVTLKFIVNRAF